MPKQQAGPGVTACAATRACRTPDKLLVIAASAKRKRNGRGDTCPLAPLWIRHCSEHYGASVSVIADCRAARSPFLLVCGYYYLPSRFHTIMLYTLTACNNKFTRERRCARAVHLVSRSHTLTLARGGSGLMHSSQGMQLAWKLLLGFILMQHGLHNW